MRTSVQATNSKAWHEAQSSLSQRTGKLQEEKEGGRGKTENFSLVCWEGGGQVKGCR